MKKGIHPETHRSTVTCISCGTTFEVGSTQGNQSRYLFQLPPILHRQAKICSS